MLSLVVPMFCPCGSQVVPSGLYVQLCVTVYNCLSLFTTVCHCMSLCVTVRLQTDRNNPAEYGFIRKRIIRFDQNRIPFQIIRFRFNQKRICIFNIRLKPIRNRTIGQIIRFNRILNGYEGFYNSIKESSIFTIIYHLKTDSIFWDSGNNHNIGKMYRLE